MTLTLTLPTGGASGDWNMTGAAGGDWSSGAAAGGDGFTSQDARSGGNDFGAADSGFGDASGEGAGAEGDGGACRNCGQGESTTTMVRYQRHLIITPQTGISLAIALSLESMGAALASTAARRVMARPSAPMHELHEPSTASADSAPRLISSPLLTSIFPLLISTTPSRG
jgi:hypothetical protein